MDLQSSDSVVSIGPEAVVLGFDEKDSPPQQEPVEGPADESALSPCVLVVEDEPDALESTLELLRLEGYNALGARHGEEALALLRAGKRPALILLDLKMPVMDGFEFCDAVAQDDRLAEIPIAVVTASASLDRVPSRRNNAGFFVKPVNFDRLLRVVRNYCG
jgi:two-component system, chemotaxis family, chemotaxis protein CheY